MRQERSEERRAIQDTGCRIHKIREKGEEMREE